MLDEVRRVLGPAGFLSFYPGDPEVSGNVTELETIMAEIQDAGFYREDEYVDRVLHENGIESGHVYRFGKTQ